MSQMNKLKTKASAEKKGNFSTNSMKNILREYGVRLVGMADNLTVKNGSMGK